MLHQYFHNIIVSCYYLVLLLSIKPCHSFSIQTLQTRDGNYFERKRTKPFAKGITTCAASSSAGSTNAAFITPTPYELVANHFEVGKILPGLLATIPLPPQSSPNDCDNDGEVESNCGHQQPSTIICSKQISYTQRTTNTRITTYANIQSARLRFHSEFNDQNNPDVMSTSAIRSVSSPSPDQVLIRWNATWTPPTTMWLRGLGESWPGGGISIQPVSYTHLSGEESVFSWSAIGSLVWDAAVSGVLRVPLACVEGQSLLRFTRCLHLEEGSDGDDNNGGGGGVSKGGNWILESITEDLSYAQDLQRGALRNRRCATDLRLFLELGRRPMHRNNNSNFISENDNDVMSWDEWHDLVANCLPWETVPGWNVMDIEPLDPEEGDTPIILFLGLSMTVLLTFGFVVGPMLFLGGSDNAKTFSDVYGASTDLFGSTSEIQIPYGMF